MKSFCKITSLGGWKMEDQAEGDNGAADQHEDHCDQTLEDAFPHRLDVPPDHAVGTLNVKCI